MNSWLKKSLALYSVSGLSFLLSILIIPVLVQCVGFKGYGIYSVYIILSSTLLFLDSALSKSAVGLIYSAKAECREQLINACRVAYVGVGIMLLLLAPLIAKGITVLFPLDTGGLDLAYWIGTAAVVEYVLALPGQYFQMLNVLKAKHFTYSQYQLCIQLSRFFSVAVVAVVTHQIEWIIAAIVLRKIPDYFILWLFWRKQTLNLKVPIVWSLVPTLYRLALPIVGVALLQVLTTEFISIYITQAYGSELLGKYRSIYDVVNKIWFIATLYPVLVYPKICEWLADNDSKTWLQKMIPYLSLGSALVYGAIALTGLIFYPLIAQWFPTLQDANPFAAGLIAGICMSGHVRLGYEFLQAQKKATSALLINALSLAAGAVTLFAFYERGTREIGLAWFVSQLLAIVVVDIYNGALLNASFQKSILGLLPWLGLSIVVFLNPASSTIGTVTPIIILSVFIINFFFLAKKLHDSR